MLFFSDDAKAAIFKLKADTVDRKTLKIVGRIMDGIQERDRQVQCSAMSQDALDFCQHRGTRINMFQYLEQQDDINRVVHNRKVSSVGEHVRS